MLSVQLSYNPYLCETDLFVEEQRWEKSFGRLGTFVVGQAIESWLPSYRKGYRRWNGFLPELMSELNEDAINLTFLGVPEDFFLFQSKLDEQRGILADIGYSDSYYKVCFQEVFLPENVGKVLLRFAQATASRVPSQHASFLLDLVLEQLGEKRPLTVEVVRESVLNMRKAFADAIAYCGNAAHSKAAQWRKNDADLTAILKRGGI